MTILDFINGLPKQKEITKNQFSILFLPRLPFKYSQDLYIPTYAFQMSYIPCHRYCWWPSQSPFTRPIYSSPSCWRCWLPMSPPAPWAGDEWTTSTWGTKEVMLPLHPNTPEPLLWGKTLCGAICTSELTVGSGLVYTFLEPTSHISSSPGLSFFLTHLLISPNKISAQNPFLRLQFKKRGSRLFF